MFYGYESESQMREYNPTIADHLISIAEKSPMVVCTRGKQCTGSIDGKEFMYADGSKDFGVTITHCRAKLGENVFRWSLENSQAQPREALS
jgi:hypothetical protein